MLRFFALILMLPLAVRATTQEILDLLFATHEIREVALAPDGGRVAWVEKVNHADRSPSPDKAIYVLDAGATEPRRVTAGHGQSWHEEKNPSWSPDSASLAFLSDAAESEAKGPRQQQLFIMPAAGGGARKVTQLTGQLERPRWSPDGKTIALLFIANQLHPAGAIEAAARDAGEVEEEIFEQRILLVDVTTGGTRFVTPEDTYVYEFDWSPNGRELAYTAARGSGDNNWWIARLYAVEIETARGRELHRPATQIAVPRWSPDGRTVAFIEGLMSDAGLTGGDIWCVGADGKAPRNLTPNRASSPAWIRWLPTANQILFTERISGGTAIARLDVVTGKTQSLWQGDESIGGVGDDNFSLSVAADGTTTAVLRSSWLRAPEIWVGTAGAWQQRTHRNTALQPRWGRAEKLEWNSDGARVQGWLLYPLNFDPARKYPLVVSVHGGPASQLTPAWPIPWFNLTVLSGEGYFVFFPNPRGSYGQGEAFTAANVKDFGHGDLRDILRGLDVVLTKAPIDPQRVGVGGWSYGGFMTMWALTQTSRFRAAVAGAGIANWQSYYGQNLIDQWMIPYFGASVYDDPATYAKSSPIGFIKAVKTPTLLVVGDADKECPPAQSYEYWHALKSLEVPTRLVIYPGEGHRFRNPQHIEDLFRRTIAWFDQHLK